MVGQVPTRDFKLSGGERSLSDTLQEMGCRFSLCGYWRQIKMRKRNRMVSEYAVEGNMRHFHDIFL